MARRIWDTQDSLDRFFAVSELALASREFGSLTNAPMQATLFAFIADESDSGGLSWFANQPAPTLYRLSDPTAAKHASFAQFQAAEALAGTTIDPAALALGQLLVAEAREHIGEEYYWSRRPDGTYMDVRSQLTNANYGAGPNEGWDCAEFVSWSVYQIYGKALGSTEAGGAFSARGWRDVVQDANLTIDIPNAEDARGIAGAIIVNKAGTHVAISLGNGHFIEANVDWNAELNTYYSDPGGRGATVTDWSTNPGTLAVSRYALFQDTPTGVDVGDVKIKTYEGVNLQAQGWHAAILRPSGYQPPKPEATDLGNSFATATAKSLPYASQSARVGFSGDTDDYIVFTASSDGKVTVKLSELTADIDLRAYNASSSAAQIVASATRSNADETIEFNVLQGQQYWVRVDPNGSVASSYKLTVTLDKNPVAGDKFGNSFETAKKINVDEPVSDHVGHGADDDDYIWFTAPGDGYITATLSKMTQDLDLKAYDANRTALGAAPEAPGNDDEAMTFKVKAGEKYYIRVDPDGNAESNFSLKLTFASGDKDNPDIVAVTPTKGKTGVGLNDNIVITFDETVQAGSGYIELFADGKTFEKFKASDPRVTIAGGVVTIDPTKSFAVGTKYTVKIDEGAFKDAAGNKSDAITSSKVSFTTTGQKDTDNPDLESVVPTKDKKNVGLNDNITLNFDEAVKAGTGYIEIFGDGKSFERFKVTDPRVTIAGDVVTIDPKGTFKPGTVYTAKIDEGAFVDAAGNKSDAITSKISFTTLAPKDTDNPDIDSVTPSKGKTGVGLTENIVIKFDEAVVRGSGYIEIFADGKSFEKFKVTDGQVSITGSNVTLNPSKNFTAGTKYTIKIDEGAFQDAAGNKSDAITSSKVSFTTAGTKDTDNPDIDSVTPSKGKTGVGLTENIVIKFDETVVRGSGYIEIFADGKSFEKFKVTDGQVSITGGTVTLNPSKNFTAGTKYTIKIDEGAFVDAAGNKSDAVTSSKVSFTTTGTKDTDTPDIDSVTPSKGKTGVSLTENIIIKFDETVVRGSGYIEIFADGKSFEKFKVTDGQVSITGGTVTLNPSKNFTAGTKYTVEIDQGAFEDAAGNKSGEIDSSEISFTTAGTKDTDTPDIDSVTPSKGKTGVSLTENIVIKFDETVVRGSGYIEILADGKSFEKFKVTDSQVSITGGIVTLNPSKNFAAGTKYTVEIDQGAFEDTAGNKSGEIDSSDISFTTAGTKDTKEPEIVSMNPRDGATGVNRNQDIVLTFNEAVFKGEGDIRLRKWSGSGGSETIDVDSSKVKINGSTVTIELKTMDANTRYYLTVEDGAFVDAAGNAFDELTGKGDLDFTTGSSSAPLAGEEVDPLVLPAESDGDGTAKGGAGGEPLVLPGEVEGQWRPELDLSDPLILPAGYGGEDADNAELQGDDDLGPLILPAGLEGKDSGEEAPVICPPGEMDEAARPVRPTLDAEELGLGDFMGRDPHRIASVSLPYDWIV